MYLNKYAILSFIVLTLGFAISSSAQEVSSASYGNTFVHHDVEMVIFGYHNFERGSLQAQPGVIGTERISPRGYIGLTNSSQIVGAHNGAHIDGYVRFHGEGTMILPLGDNGIYAPLYTEQEDGVLGASYFNANPSVAVTDRLDGGDYTPLPEHGPFNINNHGPDITAISDYEYWHIEGDANAKITLFYNSGSGLEQLTNNNPQNLSIVGWNGSSWEVIPSDIVSTTLGENLIEGSIASRQNITPEQYSILTFASIGEEEITPGVIAGVAWDDINGDGIKQENESFLPGIDLILEDCDFGNEVYIITTDANGKYNFEDLPDGVYRVKLNENEVDITQAPSTIPETKSETITNDFGRDGATICIEIKYGSKHTDIDLGIVSLSTIGDFVWLDENKNGIIDNDESGLVDVAISLIQGDSLVASTYSDINGFYSFEGVYPGRYHIEVMSPSNLDFTKSISSSTEKNSDIDHSNGAGTSYSFNLNSNETKLDMDIGLAECTTISDYVWIDRDKNNIYNEGDTRKSNVEVHLYKSTADGYILYSSTVTNGEGQYTFCVATGTYYLEFVKPYGLYEFVTANEGDNEQIDSDVDGSFGEGTTSTFKVDKGQTVEGISAGLNSEDFVGTMVWQDQNRDGIRQITEPGIAGVKVEMYSANHELVMTNKTDENGRIIRTGVEEGGYYLRIPDIGDYEFTSPFAGTDRSRDNDFNESNGRNTSGTFEVIKGYSNSNIDAGFMTDECFFTPLAYDLRIGSRGIDVVWETGNEDEISHYVLEKESSSADFTEMRSYSPIGRSHQIYGFTDVDYEPGKTYSFRIIAYQLDGEVCISGIKSIRIPEADVVIDIIEEEGNSIDIGFNDPCAFAPSKVYHKIIDEQPKIVWETGEEKDIDLFIVQRKLRISDRYVAIDTTMSSQRSNQIYAKIDPSNLLPGTYYYRLVTITMDGTECISKVITVKVDEESESPVRAYEDVLEDTDPFKTDEVVVQDVLLYPNPATDNVNLKIRVDGLSLIEVNIYDTQGQRVLTDVISGMINDEVVIFEIPIHDLKEGVYFLRTEINGKMVVRKLVKQAAFSNR